MAKDCKSLHWFCFTYTETTDAGVVYADTYTGYPTEHVTKQMIEQNKEYAGVTKKAVLMAMSYLGWMPTNEFTG